MDSLVSMVGKEYSGGMRTMASHFPFLLQITTYTSVQQKETKVNPRGIILPPSSLGRASSGPGLAPLDQLLPRQVYL